MGSRLILDKKSFTFSCSEGTEFHCSVTDGKEKTSTLTLFAPTMKCMNLLMELRAILSKHFYAAAAVMSSFSKDVDEEAIANAKTKEKSETEEVEANEAVTQVVFAELGDDYPKYLKLFKQLLCVKGICAIGDFQGRDIEPTTLYLGAATVDMLGLDDLEEIAVSYAARFNILSKKLMGK